MSKVAVVGEAVNKEVDLEDQFGLTENNYATSPKLLCAPVDKNGEGILNEDIHLTCYDVVTTASVNKDVKVSNQFGPDQLLSVQQGNTLCVPSTKEVVGPTPVPPASCDDGKPQALVFEYTGADCSASTNTQEGKAMCEDLVAGTGPGTGPVTVKYSGKGSKNITVTPGGEEVVAGPVTSEVTIAASGGGKKGKRLESKTKLEIMQGGVTLQWLEVHTSCSKSLDVGDVFGGLTLRAFVPE